MLGFDGRLRILYARRGYVFTSLNCAHTLLNVNTLVSKVRTFANSLVPSFATAVA